VLWEQIRDRQNIFSGVFASSLGTTKFDLAEGGESQLVIGLYVSGDFFNTLGVSPAAGRLFTNSDDFRGCPGTVVLSYGFWQEHYGGEQSAIGSTLSLNRHSFQVIGVAAPRFFGVSVGQHFDVAIPICSTAIINGTSLMLDQRAAWWLSIVGRPKAGTSPEKVNAQLQALSPDILAATVPLNWKSDMQKNFLSRTLVGVPAGTGMSNIRRAYFQPLRMLTIVVGLVLLIACANIASLMLARAATRRKEIAVRLAMGASRSRLIRQLLTECVLLSSLGALLGILFARWGCALLVRFISTTKNPVFLQLSLDSRILGFTAAIAVLTGVLFGLIPALRSTRISLSGAMKGSQPTDIESHSHLRPGRWIVAAQVALSLVLVIVAGLFLRSFNNLLTLDAGFDRSNVLLISTSVHDRSITPAQLPALYQQILEHLSALPGVTSASASLLTPLSGSTWDNNFYREKGGGPAPAESDADMNYISPGYFSTLRSPLRTGRNFDERDTVTAPSVAIINETMARKFFPDSAAIGQYLRIDDINPSTKTPPFQIVGIVKDAKYDSLRESMPSTIFFPLAQLKDTIQPQFEVRTTAQPSSLTRSAAAAITAINKDISLSFRTLESQVDDSMRQEQLLATLSGFFGGLALLLAMIGLYGVLAYMVTQRRKEIGIRMALGAGKSSILFLIMRDVSIVLAAGIVAGVGISLWATHFMQKMLFNLNSRDPKTVVVSVAVLSAVALIAGYLPARRAARLDPNVILRDE
jgi:putative ABC transport system permease protein